MKWRALEISSGTVNEFGERAYGFGDRIYEFGERAYRFEDRAHGLEDRTVGVRCRTDGLVLQAAHPAKSCIAGAGLLRTSEPGAMIRGSLSVCSSLRRSVGFALGGAGNPPPRGVFGYPSHQARVARTLRPAAAYARSAFLGKQGLQT